MRAKPKIFVCYLQYSQPFGHQPGWYWWWQPRAGKAADYHGPFDSEDKCRADLDVAIRTRAEVEVRRI